MAKKENNYYFDTFTKQISYSGEAATLLQKIFDNFDAAALRGQLNDMHNIEHRADTIKHDMMERLVKEFLPPIEREDIVELAHVIDDVTDAIEDVLMGAYTYNVTGLRSDVKEFTQLIVRSCKSLNDLAVELHNYKKSTVLKDKIIEISKLEEAGDRLYTDAIHSLYTEEKDAITVMAWTKMYDRLEKCLDCCNEVAKMAEMIVMKNS